MLNASWIDEEPIEDFDERFPQGTDERTAMANVLNFSESVSLATFRGLINKDLAIETFGEFFLDFWPEISPLLERRSNSDSYSQYTYIEWFALESMKHPENIGKNVLSKVKKLRKELL